MSSAFAKLFHEPILVPIHWMKHTAIVIMSEITCNVSAMYLSASGNAEIRISVPCGVARTAQWRAASVVSASNRTILHFGVRSQTIHRSTRPPADSAIGEFKLFTCYELLAHFSLPVLR